MQHTFIKDTAGTISLTAIIPCPATTCKCSTDTLELYRSSGHNAYAPMSTRAKTTPCTNHTFTRASVVQGLTNAPILCYADRCFSLRMKTLTESWRYYRARLRSSARSDDSHQHGEHVDTRLKCSPIVTPRNAREPNALTSSTTRPLSNEVLSQSKACTRTRTVLQSSPSKPGCTKCAYNKA